VNQALNSFNVFIDQFNDGSITEDAAWRAYNIEAMAEKGGKQFWTEEQLQIAEQQKTRGMMKPRAEYLFKLWRMWRSIATGHRRKCLILRDVQGS